MKSFFATTGFGRTGLLATAILALVLSCLSQVPTPTQARRLILKDGSYQSVTKYEIHGDRFRSELALQAALLKLSGCVPVDQRVRDFLPFAALGAEIADAVSVNLILGDGLVGAVFQD